MNEHHLLDVEREIDRFQQRLIEFRARGFEGPYYCEPCAESGALKRASMDLTRALAKLRSRE